ncbi:PTS transporter subunit EIIC, partial [Escherichia coli]|nr:PTS transporter subunit EIIC [Escherichia coli]
INPEINMGVLAGIITGLGGGGGHKRWVDIKMPGFLSFFRGESLLPVATRLFFLVLAGLFCFVWAPVQPAFHARGGGVGFWGGFPAARCCPRASLFPSSILYLPLCGTTRPHSPSSLLLPAISSPLLLPIFAPSSLALLSHLSS